ncbi:unnamed protein product [Anisakis simplex]|uniref:Hemicentin-1 (inferred by orthology to a human protein) n=1 Tax=Anisakis simplex TaxID=6269 RepID=A0A0M3JUZ4_ANISI|nr:unnamed protein product [Anisakis simplex]
METLLITEDSFCHGQFVLFVEVDSSARVEVYPLHIPDERKPQRAAPQLRQQVPEQFQQQQLQLQLRQQREREQQLQQHQVQETSQRQVTQRRESPPERRQLPQQQPYYQTSQSQQQVRLQQQHQQQQQQQQLEQQRREYLEEHQPIRHIAQQPQYAQQGYQQRQIKQATYQQIRERSSPPPVQQPRYQQQAEYQYVQTQERYYPQQQQQERQQSYDYYQRPYQYHTRDADPHYQQYAQQVSPPQQYRVREPPSPAQLNYQQKYQQQYQLHNPNQYQRRYYDQAAENQEENYYKMHVLQRKPLHQQQQAVVTSPPNLAARSARAQQAAAMVPGMKPPQFIGVPASTTVKFGQSVTFTAKATGHPLPEIRWYRSSGAEIESVGRFNVNNFMDGTSTLKIEQCSTADADAYLCVASNDGGAVQTRCSLTVIEGSGATKPEFLGKFQSVTIFEGDSLKLYCKASGEGIKMSWFKDDVPIKTGGIFKVEDHGNGETILHIDGAKMSDGGWYRCDASNPQGSSSLKGRVVVQSRRKHPSPSPIEQVILRKVDRRVMRDGRLSEEPRAPSKEAPKLVASFPTMNLIEGQTARFECRITPADDPNLKIAWLLNGKAILASTRITTIVEGGYAVLEISPVTVFDKGEYTIVAVNTLGESRQSVHLDVIGLFCSIHTLINPTPRPIAKYVEGHRSVTDVSTLTNITNLQAQQQLTQVQEAERLTRMGTTVQTTAGHLIEIPNFHSELRSMEIFDGQNLHLEAKLSPANDPNLKIVWLFNGKIITQSERIKITHGHGFVTLDIIGITVAEAGTYVSNLYDLQLSDFHCDQEMGRSCFEARMTPINDPSLRVIWLKDGQGLPNATRIQTFQNFGCVSLTLNPTYPEDAGTYTCVLRNAYGEAQSSAHLTTVWSDSLQTDTKHEESLAQIGYLDSYKVHIGPQAVERPEEFNSMQPPRFARQLASRVEVNENEPVHFEARVQPASDVKMAVEWYHNGAPLTAAHRFRPMFDFGYVALDILYAYPEDSGTYTLVARNELGEVQSNLELIVNSQKSLYLDANHPEASLTHTKQVHFEGLERIRELEQDRMKPLEQPPDRECHNPPNFIGDLNDMELSEHEDIRVSLKLIPVNDPTMVVEWYLNGQPLLTGSRIRTTNDFGFLTMDIRGAISEDSGVYTVKATNALGEASRQCQIVVKPHAVVQSQTQHEESLNKIQEIENLNKYGRAEIEDQQPQGPPQFIQMLPGNIGEVEEGQPLHMECQVRPIGDNTLTISWLKDGHPIPTGHRFRTFHDFGYVSLDVLDVYAPDSGTYTCIAKNALGQAETSLSFSCKAKAAIVGQTHHPTSVARIQEIEAPKAAPAESPELQKESPRFIKPLSDGQMVYVTEGDSVFLEAQVVPTDDNTMTYEWLLNDRPLMKAHRFVLSHDFGFVALNILYMYPEDSGTYTLIVRNAAGEARSTMDIDCAVKGHMITESFHPNSIQRIRELEMPLQPPDERPEAPRMAPQIVRALPQQMDSVHESQTLHLEAQILPVDDNKLKVEWLHNGHPLKASSRYRLMNDFGFVSLDIDYIIAEDSGTYTLVITNPEGRAETSTQFDVIRLQSIVGDSSHPESLRRIQEIEAMQPAKPEEEEYVPEVPVFTQPLTGPSEILKEGQSVHMDCMVQPITDPNLKIEWFLNGHPILFGSRIRTIHDFGYVGLEFLHVHPEDTGTYTCKASNAAGEAITEFAFECKPRRNIYLDTQHVESWAQIQELENREEVRPPTPDQVFPPPTFTEPLQNVEGLVEGESVRLECRLQPVNDPTLKVYWTVNGQPIPEGSRFMPARNFDYVNLDLLAVYPEDSGVYSCRAVSEFGEATTSCTVKCQPTDALMLDTQHEESWNQIQDIENRRPEEPIYEEPEKMPPRFVVQLPSQLGDFDEGAPVHFEAQIEPTNDNKLTVQWYHNGHPLVNAHRFRTTHDFGYVALDILYAFPEDSGEWTCLVKNELGEAQSSTSFSVAGKAVILGETQHPESLRRIKQIEAPKEQPPEMPELKHGPPQFVEPMNSVERIEGQPVHFETRVLPVNDPKMRIQWYKDGAPLQNSNRFNHTSDFGFVGLDIAYTIPEDAGNYTVVATNDQGEDRIDAQLSVNSRSAILGDSQNQSSWEKIRILEEPKKKVEAEPEMVVGPPHFITQLNSITGLIEGQPAHFEATFEPISDPRMVIVWYHNGHPLAASSRMTMRNDFGLVTLDIHYVLPEDIGEFKCVATNQKGEDSTSAQLQCQTRASILGDVQHEESWKRIQAIEAPKAAPAAPEPTVYAKPTFTQPLQSIADVPEGGIALLQARVVPVNDPNLQILWFHNDAPLQQSNWYTMTNDFGCVGLRIAPVYPHHSGVYSCKAVNQQGTAITSASLSVIGEESLQMDTQHPDSLQKIQQLESLDKFPRLEMPEMEFDKPVWVQSFDNIDDLPEGEIVHLSGNVEPSGDPNMKIEWFLNGAPLMNSNRYRQEYEFGNVTLTIVHVLPQDSGLYTCKAINRSGDASTSATVKVAGYEAILRDTQHPVSWEQIQVLETPIVPEEVEEVVEKEKPRFLSQLESFTDIPEGEVVHLEATFQPARDPDLKVIWLRNGQPLGASQLIKTRSELGWAALDINGVNLDHNGIYTLKIVNSEGEAASSASIKVAGVGDVLTDTSHEESWRRIQEIEAPKEMPEEAPAPVYDAPSIQTQIVDLECNEGEPSHFEAVITPTNDPRLVAVWYRNGQPLAHGSKYAISQDFGFCTLDIGYTFPEDQGIYQLRVTNENGEAVSSATLKCHGKDAILGDTQHEESWRRIQEIEAPKAPVPEMAPAPKTPPKFITQIQNIHDLYEGQPAHFEATVEPIDDADLKIHWYLNGAPVTASSRVKMISDFGWIILDINQTEPRDSGEWTCVAVNSAGEAKCSATVNVLGRENIVFDSIQPQSLQRIREIEAPKAMPEEAPTKVYGAPKISVQLQSPPNLSEGDSAHLEAQYTPVDDPTLKVEWFRNGQPLYHANRYKMVQDFGFAILDILHLFAQDAGEYTMKVSNDAGEAVSSAVLDIAVKENLLLQPQDEGKARAVQKLEDALHRAPEEAVVDEQKTVPVFIEPLSAPVSCEEGDRVHFSARYEPLNDNQLQIQWFLNGKPLKISSRVKSISDFGFVVLEISPTYPEDSGEYTCRAINRIGEAVTSTQLTCSPKQKIITSSQLPESMSGAQRRIVEIEAPKPSAPEKPDIEHGPPRFVTQLQNLPDLIEGQVAHLEAQVEPVADPRLKIEWFHNGHPVKQTARMKNIHDFGFVVMELSPVEPQDSGKWVCKATNSKGTAETSSDIQAINLNLNIVLFFSVYSDDIYGTRRDVTLDHFQVKGTSGVSYDWLSPAERKERITQLEEWIHRPTEGLDQPQQEYEAPHFTQDLQDLGQMNEADATAFTCILEPIGDPTLRIEWFHNGHAIPYSNRIHMTNDFGVCTLLIKHLITQDTGEYKCVARNAKGQAETVGRINVSSAIQIDSPQILQPLVDKIDDIPEGDSVHLECRVAPINDSNLSIKWYKNGAPLPEASRFKPSLEFGFVTLDILYAYPEDNGVYECVVVNDKGETRTKTTINVVPKPSLEFGPQAPGADIDSIESHLRQHTMSALVLSKEDAYDEKAQRPPEFKIQMTNVGVEEGEYCRFETQLAPVNDPYMKVEWFKDGKPVLLGHRFRSTVDFGFVCLSILYALPDDTGEYTCVATNRFGQGVLTAKLACSGSKHIITETQLPQGVLVSDVKNLGEQLYWSEQIKVEQGRAKQAPQFTIRPRNTQAIENEPARFECAVVANPKAKVIWYINGNQAIQGHRYKLHYDGVYYLTISNTRISDAGEIVVIAKNSEGEMMASAILDVFQKKDFRQLKLKPTSFKTIEELQQREISWQKETLGKLGEAFESAPRPDQQKLRKVERAHSPIEPLESEELMGKFTRPKDDQFYDQLTYVRTVETAKPTFKGMELPSVALKPGQISKYEPPKEAMESVQLKQIPKTEKPSIPTGAAVPQPSWATDKKLGDVEGRFNRMAEPEKRSELPARDQIHLKAAKPNPPTEIGHVEIEKDKAKLAPVVQGPEVPKEVSVPAKDQVQIKQKFHTKVIKPSEAPTIESEPLKDIPPVVKGCVLIHVQHRVLYQTYREHVEHSTIEININDPDTDGSDTKTTRFDYSPRRAERVIGYHIIRVCTSFPQPTKMGQTHKPPPQVTQQLKPVQVDLGRNARFFCGFDGAHPMTVTWLRDGKEIKPSFEFQVNTTNTGSTLSISKLKPEYSGEYVCRIENVAGTVESMANLTVAKPVDRGIAPSFKQRINDLRIQQNSPSVFTCVVAGTPEPSTSWFKDGKQLPNDGRYQIIQDGEKHSLRLTDTLPQDGGVYECVAKNAAGEARCKARLNIILATTGQGAEVGPRLEAPRFQSQIQPVIAQEGGPAEFRIKYTGSPDPVIRWYRNNEPVKESKFLTLTQAHGEAVFRISQCYHEDVAEYKVEASNPAGKAISVANLTLSPKTGAARQVIATKTGAKAGPPQPPPKTKPLSGSPQFISKLSDITARPGHTVKFVAEISGDPQPSVAWQFNGKPIYNGRDHKISLVGNKATLEIQRIAMANAGNYSITIRNAMGAAQCQAKLTIQTR